MRKLHAPVRAGLLQGLADVFTGGFPADKVIQRQLKLHPKWGSGDRRLFAEATYDVVRWWRRLLDAVGVSWDQADAHEPDAPTLAAVVDAWSALNDVRGPMGSVVDADRVRARWDDGSLPRATRAAVPNWMDEWGAAELGSAWDQTLEILNQTAPVYLRANRLKTRPGGLARALGAEGIETEAAGADALRLKRRANVFLTKAFRAGHFEVQDLHSQEVARALDPRPGERVIDACAGAGGKTLHLAALMENRGRVVALDVGERKLVELRRRATRAGASCLETRLITGSKVIKRLSDSADRVLLDVPCTGLGILRRNPDAKWRLKPDDVRRVRDLQGEILDGYARMCRPGGRLVYSTCSIAPSENERRVEAFLSRNETWRLDDQRTLPVTPDGGDGFFIARLTRKS